MNSDRIAELTKNANDAASQVKDPELKKIAFETILKKLLDSEISVKPKKSKKSKKKKPSKTKKSKESSSSEPDETVIKLVRKINRTKHPLLANLSTAHDKSIYILHVALDHDVDGLYPAQIEYILREKFRHKVTKNAISMALMDSKMVDRRPVTIQGGSGYTYHIMKPGQDWVATKLSEINKEKEMKETKNKNKDENLDDLFILSDSDEKNG